MPSYTQVFGNTTILPATVSYRAINMTANTTLVWALEAQAGANVAAQVMDITATAGLTLTLPDATLVSVGTSLMLSNVGANSVAVVETGGAAVLTLATSTSWVIYLTDNTTAGGTWRTYQLGALTSSATAASLAGLGLVAISTTLNTEIPFQSKNASPYTVVGNDRASALVWTGGTGTFNLTAPATLGTDWYCYVKNSGSGVLTLTPAAGTIDAQASITMNPNESLIVLCTGSLFYTLTRNTNAASFTYLAINVAGSGDITLSSVQQYKSAYLLTGVLTGARNVIVPAALHEFIVNNQTTGAFTLTVKTAAGTGIAVSQANSLQLYCDGTNVLQADTFPVGIPVPIASGGTGATTAPNALTNLGGTATGTSLFTAASTTAARSAINVYSIDESMIYSSLL